MQDPFVELTTQELERTTGGGLEGLLGGGLMNMIPGGQLFSMIPSLAKGLQGNKTADAKTTQPGNPPSGTPTADASSNPGKTSQPGGGGFDIRNLASILQNMGGAPGAPTMGLV